MAAFQQTLSQLRTTVRALTNQPGNKFLTDTNLSLFLNLAQTAIVEFTEAIVGRENQAIVANQANYSLPDDWFKTVSVQYQIASGGETRLLRPISREEYLNIRTVLTSSRPTEYTLINEDLYIFPTPTGTTDNYLHTYVQQPDELVNDADVPFKGKKHLTPFHNKLAELAVNLIRGRDKNLSIDEVVKSFIPTMAVMKSRISTEHRPGSGRVKRMYSRGDDAPPFPRLPSNY